MAFCPSCATEVEPSAEKCPNCGAQFAGSESWKPLDTPPEKITEGRPLKWWQDVLWFIVFWFAGVNLFKLLGVRGAIEQIIIGTTTAIIATFYMNTRARKRKRP
jgi:hypothetical protein